MVVSTLLLILQIIGWAILIFLILMLLAYLIEPVLIGIIYSRLISRFVKNKPFINIEENFPEAQLIKDNYHVIKQELLRIMEYEQSIPKLVDLGAVRKSVAAKDGKAWRTFIIKGFGNWIPQNCEQVPETTRLLEQIPMITTVMFSILDGNKTIFPHRGQFKGVFRYHLGMIIPTDLPCYIIVDSQKYQWKEGEHVLFDDTYLHEVYNGSAHKRVVLLCDVLRDKSLPVPLRWITKKIYFLMGNSKKAKRGYKKAGVIPLMN